MALGRILGHGRSVDDASTFYLDLDGDGYGDESMAIRSCTPGERLAILGGDCDDRASGVYPGAPETCNGIDDDCDDRVDDDTIDSSETEACACADGVDNDSDSLIDCEDGDCAASEDCIETDCADGLDDDADGLTDCDDDDCWGPECRPATIRARAMGGRMVTRRVSHRESHWQRHWSPSGVWYVYHNERSSRMNLDLYSVWGTVGTTANTCTWSFTHGVGQSWVWAEETKAGGSYRWRAGTMARDGFHLDGDCRLPDSPWFLPSRLMHGAYGTDSGGTHFFPTFRWYVLTPVGEPFDLFSYSWRSTARTSSCDGYCGSFEGHEWSLAGSSYQETIGPGATWEP